MLYTPESQTLLKELLQPIPFFVRKAAKKMIEKQIIEVAQTAEHSLVQVDDVLRGYIMAGVKKNADKERMIRFLAEKGFDLSRYQDLLA